MKPRIGPYLRPFAPLILVAACAQSPTSVSAPAGDGRDRAAPVQAVETTGRTGLRVLGLTQGRIRACSGSYEAPTLISPFRETELSCTGGVTGTARVGPDALGGRSVTWELETGESGRVRL